MKFTIHAICSLTLTASVAMAATGPVGKLAPKVMERAPEIPEMDCGWQVLVAPAKKNSIMGMIQRIGVQATPTPTYMPVPCNHFRDETLLSFECYWKVEVMPVRHDKVTKTFLQLGDQALPKQTFLPISCDYFSDSVKENPLTAVMRNGIEYVVNGKRNMPEWTRHESSRLVQTVMFLESKHGRKLTTAEFHHVKDAELQRWFDSKIK